MPRPSRSLLVSLAPLWTGRLRRRGSTLLIVRRRSGMLRTGLSGSWLRAVAGRYLVLVVIGLVVIASSRESEGKLHDGDEVR